MGEEVAEGPQEAPEKPVALAGFVWTLAALPLRPKPRHFFVYLFFAVHVISLMLYVALFINVDLNLLFK